MSIVVITGTDTAVGKTMVGAGLARALVNRGVDVRAVKPVESGTLAEPEDSEDGAILAEAARQAQPRQALTRLRAPLAPPVAAAEERVRLDMDDWCAEIQGYAAAADLVLVEGAGGVLSPLTWTETSRELATRLGARAVLVAADHLGTLNHTLMAMEVLERAGVPTAAIVFSAPATADPSTGRNAEALREFSGYDKVAVLPQSIFVRGGRRSTGYGGGVARGYRRSGVVQLTDWNEWLDASLGRLSSEDRLRDLRAVTPTSAVHAEIDGRPVVLFSSNDYLGLSAHPEVKTAAAEAAKSVGCGPRGSPLICGYTSAHQALEEEIAELKGCQGALLFPTGYAANLAVMTAMAGPGTAVYSDELNHASIIDGCRLARLSGAEVQVYPHRDVEALEELVRASRAQRHLVVTDAVFSMDGDLAPLPELVELRERYGVLLVVDEAHGTLVFGDGGGGVAEHFDVGERIDVHVGTLSKAAGALGGFVATSERLRDWLLNSSRTYIYSTAPSVPIVEAARAAIRIARRDPGIRRRLWDRVAQFGELVGTQPSSPIVPVILGDEKRALTASRHLLESGLHVVAVRPPTVPSGTSRLRVALSAAHTPEDVEALSHALGPFL